MCAGDDGPHRSTFVGLDNFVRIASDGVFWHAVQNNAWIAVSAHVAQIAVGLVIACCRVRVIPKVKRAFMFC